MKLKTGAFAGMGVAFLLWATGVVGVIYVVWHFISKFW